MSSAARPFGSPVHDGAGREDLRRRIAALGARPFLHQVVQSPWDPVIDVEPLYREAKEQILEMIATCDQPGAGRCVTVHAPAGYGKTHLLAWTRQQLDNRNDALFIYIPPYIGENGPLETHLLRFTLEALRLRSTREEQLFGDAVRNFLVKCYNHMVTSRRGAAELNAGNWWTRWLFPGRLRISRHPDENPLLPLQRAFQGRGFLRGAFTEFEAQHPPDANGLRADWDTFVAISLLVCGDTRQRDTAGRWFRNDPMAPEVFEPYHLDQPCEGREKLRNALFTLNRMVGQRFCFAFDQMEDTYTSLQAKKSWDEDMRQMSLTLRNFLAVRGFCLLFMFQTVTWLAFADTVHKMLVQRMNAGRGAIQLRALDDEMAQAVIQQRMEHAVWQRLAPERPPDGEPFFPFSANDIQQMRTDTNSELRTFLIRAAQRYAEWIQTPWEPPKRLPIRLTSIDPCKVRSLEPKPILLQGENFPADVQVFFAGQQAERVTCRPEQGQIDVTTPTGLKGEVEVRVQAADDAGNAACLPIFFQEREEVPKPYHQHIDRKLLKERRQQLKLTQRQVEKQLGKSASFLTALETGRSKPGDDIFDKLAQIYQRPLEEFRKKS
jgi:hypothetical protein